MRRKKCHQASALTRVALVAMRVLSAPVERVTPDVPVELLPGARVCVGFRCSIRLPVARDIRHFRSRFVPKTW
jgi:hypothetical protein